MDSESAYLSAAATLRKQIEDLSREVQLERIPTSTAAKDLKAFCEEHAADDYLLSPNFNVENPFKEKKSCVIV
ncbi:guanine nucleotide-binding protein G(I)/G(S)/G(O) subunit gamma-12-like [Convolutriloba macropyga]|uniref:guanine nucleotide-binding protein G(I)/G(S)/G(O) subunit gamma-12-like n=1 Tax=Convolutriloba macropyga TaxID=536237 RepID=UPI003F51C06F